MRSAKIGLAILAFVGLGGWPEPTSHAQPLDKPRIVIAAGMLLDGKGGIQRNTRVVVEGSKIVAIDPTASPVDYDLRARTVLPGWIDAHVHITWSFGADGKSTGPASTTPDASYRAAANAWATLLAGFTTVQSLGSPGDTSLRDAIARGELPGPRILTAVNPLVGRAEATGTADEIRDHIRKQKAAGADVIKVFAAGSMRDATLMMSPTQLQAACDEARKQGLRSVVHAYGSAVRATIEAGCTQIEHGLLATDEDLQLMAKAGTYFDPQAGLLVDTYFKYWDRFLGTPGYSDEALGVLKQRAPAHADLMRRAVKVPSLKIVFGTDALAGVHGRNAEEFIYRVRDGGQSPMQALISANSLGAEALGMADRIGSIAPGFEADIIALTEDPLQDMTTVRHVTFVMKGGVVYRYR